MPIDKNLLEILCCPHSKKSVNLILTDKLDFLNKSIAQGRLKYNDGSVVKENLSEGLVTEDNSMVFRIDDSIPIMLWEKGIAVDKLNWE